MIKFSLLKKSMTLSVLLAAPLLAHAQTNPAGPTPPSGATGADSGPPPVPHHDAKKAPAPDTSKASSSDKNSGSDKNKAKNTAPKQPDAKPAQ